jgi:hypothetical protein
MSSKDHLLLIQCFYRKKPKLNWLCLYWSCDRMLAIISKISLYCRWLWDSAVITESQQYRSVCKDLWNDGKFTQEICCILSCSKEVTLSPLLLKNIFQTTTQIEPSAILSAIFFAFVEKLL